MVLPLLLSLLASLQSLPSLESPAGLQPAPTLSHSPGNREYLPGDLVTLTCRAPEQVRASGYRFFYQKGQQDAIEVPPTNTRTQLEFPAEKGWAGSYTCGYWRWQRTQRIFSENSTSISIIVTAPQLSVSPQHPVYVTGEPVILMCSAAGLHTLTGIRFFRDEEQIQPQEFLSLSNLCTAKLQLSGVTKSDAGAYSCEYLRSVNGREFESERSQHIPIAVTDPPPQPALSVDPPSGAVSEGLPLLLTCTAPEDTGEQRFHFYKDGVEIVPGDAGSENNATKPSTGSVNVSVSNILRAHLTNTVEFTCGYERNVSGRWVPSPRSLAVNVPRPASPDTRDILLTAGGALLLLGALAALLCWCWRKTRILKPLKSPEGSQPRAHTRDMDPRHDNKRSNERSTGAGVKQDSEVTYTLIEFSALDAHRSPLKNKAQPAEEEHVLYSEVVTKPTRRQLNKEGKPSLHSSS